MPNPFPGMNPYFEKPYLWSGFHHATLVIFNNILGGLLPPGFATHLDVRCYVLPPERLRAERQIVPDIAIEKSPVLVMSSAVKALPIENLITPPTITLKEYSDEEEEAFIEIIDMEDKERVVTVIELLSPSNKVRGGAGNIAYRNKQRDILNSETNLLEIDLLRTGEHTIASPELPSTTDATWDYSASLYRASHPREYNVWLMNLRDPLPVLPVPLTAGFEDVPLNIQTAINRCYEEQYYERNIDYSQPVVPPLRPEDTLWAENLLREKGLRL